MRAGLSGRSRPDYRAGDGLPHQGGPGAPKKDDFAFLRLFDCRHVRIEGLRMEGFWPTILYFHDCADIVVTNCDLRHGTHAVFVRGGDRFEVAHTRWRQDDSPDHGLWHRVDWVEAHGGDGGSGTARYFNGGFFGARKFGADLHLHHNVIEDAYNGVRVKPGVDVDETATNQRFVIERNVFRRIRDNAIEPEIHASDWHVRHNTMVDCHSWFSMDGVGGGHIFIYGNTGDFASRQGRRQETAHTMGRVLKLSYQWVGRTNQASERVPAKPWAVFNNSWRLRCPLVGGAVASLGEAAPGGIGPDFTDHLTFANNAFQWCDPDREGRWVCEEINLLRHFRPGSGVVFDHSLTNRANYGANARAVGLQETALVLDEYPLFQDGSAFALREGSPGLGTGAVELPESDGTVFRIRPGADGTVNRGAVQDYGLTVLEDALLPFRLSRAGNPFSR